MKRILSSAAALALLSAAAMAADLPVYDEPPPPPAAYVPSWSGFYVGIHGGYGFDDGQHFICPAARDGIDTNGDGICECPEDGPFVLVGGNDDEGGAVIGGQIGVNWQYNLAVFGAEADGSWLGFNDDDDDLFFEASTGFDWLASIRGRAGIGFDRVLVYGTGGVAFTEFDGLDVNGDNDDELEVGWVAGGGGEFLVTDHVSIGAEYLHYEFDSDDFGDASIDVVRGRLNFKFGRFGG